MKQELIKKILEAALMVAGRPLGFNQLLDLFEKEEDRPERAEVRAALTELQTDYTDHGVAVAEPINSSSITMHFPTVLNISIAFCTAALLLLSVAIQVID